MKAASHIPRVAVVILNWNGKRFLESYLPSVLDSSYPNLDIIVADNASTDDSVSLLRSVFPEVRIIRLLQNYGYAGGYNRALNQVEADYFVLLNSDVTVEKNWIEPVIELMESDEKIAACQPKIRSMNDRSVFEYAGAAGGWIDKYGYPFCRGRVLDVCEIDTGQYNDAAEVFWASGACLFIRSCIFRESGGFDASFFAHQEEIDLCWRLQNAGYKIFVQPESIVYHLGGGSLEMGNKRKVFLNFRNNLFMLYKNLRRGELFGTLFIRMTLDGVAGIRFILQGKGGSFMAVLRAHFAFYSAIIRGGMRDRDGHRRNKSDLAGLFYGSLIWNVFVKKKKTFSEIVSNKN